MDIVVEPGTALADLDTASIMALIPHRYPMLLLDRVVDIRAVQSATGIKNVTVNESFFPGHFPNDPIMPGVMIVEAMAQAAAVLVIASLGEAARGASVYFMGIEEARFRRPVRPGDTVRLEVESLRHKLGVWKFKGRAMVDGQTSAEAQFSAKLMLG